MPVRKPSETKADAQNDDERLDEGAGKFADRLLDDLRLVGNLVDLDADRRPGADFVNGRADVLAEVQHIAAFSP